MEISQTGPVTTVRFEVKGGWDQWILFQSDNHHDSPMCNQALEREHLEEAKKRGAWVIMTGDFFDGMQGRFDGRRSYDQLRPELRREDYYDALVEYAAKFLQPYAKNILLIGDGNHETAVLKYANTNLADRLVGKLNERGKAKIVHGGYGGWVRLLVDRSGAGQGSVMIKYYHGSGGEAPVTRGAIQTNRQAVYLPDADIVVNGHSHNTYYIPIGRERITNKGRMFFDVQHHVRVPGYQQSYGDGSGGWEVSRGGVPKPIGCVWVHLRYVRNDQPMQISVQADVRGADALSLRADSYGGRVYAQDGEGA